MGKLLICVTLFITLFTFFSSCSQEEELTRMMIGISEKCHCDIRLYFKEGVRGDYRFRPWPLHPEHEKIDDGSVIFTNSDVELPKNGKCYSLSYQHVGSYENPYINKGYFLYPSRHNYLEGVICFHNNSYWFQVEWNIGNRERGIIEILFRENGPMMIKGEEFSNIKILQE